MTGMPGASRKEFDAVLSLVWRLETYAEAGMLEQDLPGLMEGWRLDQIEVVRRTLRATWRGLRAQRNDTEVVRAIVANEPRKKDRMTQSLESRVVELERVVAAMRAAFVGGQTVLPGVAPPAPAASAGPATPAVADDKLLSLSWANFTITKDPPRWDGPSYVGRVMSECPADYLLNLAGFFEWKAKKGREENPPRCNDKGKPWYERDELTAKLARGWAARNGQSAPAPAPASEPVGDAFDGDIPF